MGRLKNEITTKQNPADYWNQRFSNEGKIWGQKPSNTAKYALKLFKKYDIKKVFIPGAGYGRNSKFFSNHKTFKLMHSAYIARICISVTDARLKSILDWTFFDL